MDVEAESASSMAKNVAENNILLNLFATFVGEQVDDLLLDPNPVQDYSDDEAMEVYERSFKLKMVASVLIKSTDNINYTDDSGQTFLHHFVEIFLNESTNLSADRWVVGLEILQNLLDSGACMHLKDHEGFSPFQIVMENQCLDLKSIFVIKMRNICICFVEDCEEKRVMNGNSCRPYPAEYLLEIFVICLENELTFNSHTTTNATPLILLCEFCSDTKYIDARRMVDAVRASVHSGCNVNAVDSRGLSALHHAIEKSGIDLIEILVELGANVNQATKDQHTPLDLAMKIQSLEKIKLLIQAGANVNSEIIKNIISLIFTIKAQQLNIDPKLINCNVNVEYHNDFLQFNSFHVAALEFDPFFLKLMLKTGLDIDERTKCGLTALHLASLTGKLTIVQLLTKHGADVHCREPRYGLTPIHFAAMTPEKFFEIVQQRRSHRTVYLASLYSTLESHSRQENQHHTSVVEHLIINGASVHVKDSRGMTPLQYASIRPGIPLPRHNVLPILLNSGAYVNQQEDDGHSPVHNATQERNISALMHLIRFGADLSDVESKCFNELFRSNVYFRWELSSKSELTEFHHCVTKLKIAGLINVDLSLWNRFDDNSQIYGNHCKQYSEEVTKLKKYFIEGHISLHNWLSMNYTKARPFYLNEVPLELKSEFPLYYEVIQSRYRMVVERIPLLEPAKLAWYQITRIDLPEICMDRILFYLNNRYLRVLADNFEKNEI